MYAITPRGVGNPVGFRAISDNERLVAGESFTVAYKPEGYVLDDDSMSLRKLTSVEVLSDSRHAKRADLKAARDSALTSGVTYKGMVFHSDRDSITDVFQALQGLQTVNALPDELKAFLPGPIPETIQWKLKDNTYTDLTMDDLIFLMAILSLFKEAQFKKEAEKLEALNTATTEADIKKVTW